MWILLGHSMMHIKQEYAGLRELRGEILGINLRDKKDVKSKQSKTDKDCVKTV